MLDQRVRYAKQFVLVCEQCLWRNQYISVDLLSVESAHGILHE